MSRLSKISKIDDEGITFANGWMLISTHEQCCCESHWVAFEQAEDFDRDLCLFDLDAIFFEQVPGYGIRLLPINAQPISIPGYSDNNGFYSDKLELELLDENGRERALWDITDCQEEQP
jgi:hypothetical protein